MSYVLTLVAGTGVFAGQTHIATTAAYLEEQGIWQTCEPVWLQTGKAVDIGLSDEPDFSHIRALQNSLQQEKIDVFISPIEHRRKKLLLSDMDSTIVSTETLDEVAAEAGVGESIAAITEQAMNGEIDFQSALRARIKLLAGQSEEILFKTLQKTTPNPGAQTLVKTMNYYGAKTVLVTGGFTYFSSVIAAKLGFADHQANELDIEDGKLTGRVREPILDKNAKLKTLYECSQQLKIRPSMALAVGDGANDLPMLREAGLGIGYRPKRVVAEEMKNLVLHGDLTAILYAQGYTEQHIREAMADNAPL
jgi:phosphoserine phosphatase